MNDQSVQPQPKHSTSTARLATLDELLKSTIPAFLSPVPSRETLRKWFDAAGISRWQANPLAKRGGGPVWYSVCGVEKLLRNRLLPGKASTIRAAQTQARGGL